MQTTEDISGHTQRTIGVTGAVMILVGFVVGVSIFVLPTELASTTGPAVILAYFVAAGVALFSCFVAAQIGALYPVTGASFVSISDQLHPLFGFLFVWQIISAIAVAVALVAFAFADYFAVLVPGLNRTAVAVGVIALLCALNLRGTQASVIGQGLMVVFFLLIIGVYCTAGFLNLEADLFTPFIPGGVGSIFTAAIPAIFSYAGFLLIIEIGGEIENPRRTVPRAVFISFALVLLTYTLVSVVAVGVMPWQDLQGHSAPFALLSGKVLPGWMGPVIVVTTLMAAASSINGLILGYSRDVKVLADARLFPPGLGRVSARTGVPGNGVLLLSGLSLLVLPFGASVSEYATYTVLALMAGQVLLGLTVLRMTPEKTYPAGNEHMWMGAPGRWIAGGGLVLVSGALLVVGASGSPKSALAVLGMTVLGVLYYLIRTKRTGNGSETPNS